jgi:enoyl-CoA hydratase/carnithine racemase
VTNDHALFEVEGPIAFFTFNRPEARNAMTWEMYEALVEACDRVDGNAEIRVFVLRGAGGKAFVSGTDIGQFTRFNSKADAIAYERRLDNVFDRLERVRVPTIAQIQGAATGGGCVIALCCDLRVCTHDSKLGVPIARTLGNCLSASNYARLLDLVGPARAKDLMFTGRLIDAAEAASVGLVNRIVDDWGIDAAVRELAATLAANAPLTIRATKEVIRRVQESRRPELTSGDDWVATCYGSEDFKEGVAAFLDKRRPVFRGQ